MIYLYAYLWFFYNRFTFPAVILHRRDNRYPASQIVQQLAFFPLPIVFFPVDKKRWRSVYATSDAAFKVLMHFFCGSVLLNVMMEAFHAEANGFCEKKDMFNVEHFLIFKNDVMHFPEFVL